MCPTTPYSKFGEILQVYSPLMFRGNLNVTCAFQRLINKYAAISVHATGNTEMFFLV